MDLNTLAGADADADPAGGAAAFSARAGRLGAVLGLALGVLGQTAVHAWSAASVEATPWPSQRLLGVLTLSAGYALVAIVVSGLSLRIFGALLKSVSRATRCAVVATAVVLSALAFVHVVGLVVRVLSGAHLSLGAITFCIGSWEHFLHAGVSGYVRFTLPAVVGIAVMGCGLGFMLRRMARLPASNIRGERELLVQGAAGLTLLLVAFFAPVSERYLRGVASTTPELALIESLVDVPLGSARVRTESERQALVALQSPPLAAGSMWQASLAPAGADAPNLLLITLESVTPKHMRAFGYHRTVTPHLDELASRALVAPRAWTTATHSNYAQMAILSSLFPRRMGSLDMYRRIDYPRLLLHDFAFEKGYATATISSQDENWQGMLRFQQTATPTFFYHATDYEGPHLDTGTEKVIPDHVTAERAARWIDEQKGPWQLYVNFQATHFPYAIPKNAPRPFEPHVPRGAFSYVGYDQEDVGRVVNMYDNALSYVDAQIGRLKSHLEQRGQLHKTIWVITSDHGEMFYEHGLATHGRTLYDAEARVPFIIHYPDVLAPAEIDQPVSHVDILPTILALLSADPYPGYQGRNLLEPPSPADPPRAIYMNIQGWTHVDAIVCEPYKLIVDNSKHRVELYDLERDPTEKNDLSANEPRIVDELSTVLEAMILAQERYHSGDTTYRTRSFAPRMLPCPRLPRPGALAKSGEETGEGASAPHHRSKAAVERVTTGSLEKLH